MRSTCLIGFLAAVATLAVRGPAPPLPASSAQAPDQWFYEQRAYPLGTIPENAWEKALRQKAALESRVRTFGGRAPQAAAAATPWALLGPGGINSPEGSVSGRVTAAVTDPRNPEHVYIAAAGGGVWRSTDGGGTWQSLGDNLLSLSSGALVLDERIGALYYGTGDASSNGYGAGILRSTDAGGTWQQLSAQFSLGVTFRIVLHPLDPRTLFVARSSGVWRSTDGGDTWIRLLAGFATDLAVDVNDPRLMFAALGRVTGAAENGVYRSLDSGNSWTLVQGLPAGASVGRISLAQSTANPAVAYAVVTRSSDFSLEGLYRSDDFGGAWRRLPNAPRDLFLNGDAHQGHFDNMIVLDPRSPERVYLGGVELYRSTDGGNSWTNLSLRGGQRVIHEDQFALAFKPNNPDAIYMGNDGGIYRSNDGGDTWTNLNRALPITQFYNVAVNTAGGLAFLGGTQDNGVIRLAGGAPSWEQVLRGDGGAVMFDLSNPSVLYAARQRIQPMRSRDSGTAWSLIAQGIAAGDRVAFFPPFVMDPGRPQQLLFGTQRVWRSTDGGESWTAASADLTSGGFLTALVISPTVFGLSRSYYAATSDGQVSATQDGGINWQRGTGVPNRWITSLGVDPRLALRAYFTASGFGTGHVFRTQDGGVTWQDVSANLPDAPANAVAVDTRGAVYVATDVGVFRSDDGNGNWIPFSLGLPNSFVTALALDSGSTMLVVGTYGRGAYGLDLRPPQLAAGAAVNAASSSPVLAPGAIVSLYGDRLASTTVANNKLPVDTSLANTTVTVNGIAAPLFFVSPQQINFQVPFEVNTSSATVVITTPLGSASTVAPLAPTSPGIFPNSIYHANGRAVDATNAAVFGEVLTLFATGLGATSPPVASGVAAPSAPPARTVLAATVTIGTTSAPVVFSGLAPGFVGLYQVNFVMPLLLSRGETPLALSAGGRPSNSVAILVR